ncbi:MAG: aminotransferase class V-fold PLP-dependent enzyme [Acidimicrobiales bacterium]
MGTGLARAAAAELDVHDPLARWVDGFVVERPAEIYFDGNSLGRLSHRTRARVEAAVAGWGTDLVQGWREWIDLPTDVGDRIGRAVLGASSGQTVVCDCTTVNLFKLAGAAVAAGRPRSTIVTDGANFPTDRYVLAGLADTHRLDLRLIERVDPEAVTDALDDSVALVALSHVDYRSGAIADVAGITAAVHRCGALVLWDLSHSAGALEIELDAWDVDLAVGCSYKYLNGGPGAPAWLYVNRRHHEVLAPPIWGWFAQADQFAMGPEFRPDTGIRRWLTGTPPILGIAAVDESVAMIEEAGIRAIRAKGSALTTYAAELAAAWLEPLGFDCPAVATRGSHLALVHPDAYRLSCALIAEAGVVADFREPDILRIGLSPLMTRFVDVWDGFDRIRALTERCAWERYDVTRGRVT